MTGIAGGVPARSLEEFGAPIAGDDEAAGSSLLANELQEIPN